MKKIKIILTTIIVVFLLTAIASFTGLLDSKPMVVDPKAEAQALTDKYIDCVNLGECEDPNNWLTDSVHDTNTAKATKVAENGNSKPNKAIVQFTSSQIDLVNHLKNLSGEYNQDFATLNKVITCESNYTIANHDGGRGKGVTGFWKTTFDLWHPKFTKETGRKLNYSSQKDQIELMVWAFSKGENYRNDWSSYNKLVRYGECNNGKLRKMGIKNINIYPVN